jgi:hypothetical protein
MRSIKKFCFFGLFLILVAFISDQVYLLGDELQIKQVVEEAIKSWEIYSQSLSHCEGIQTTNYVWYNSNGSISERETRVSETISDYPFIVSSFYKNSGKQQVFGSNKRYNFKIREEEKNEWIVSSVNPNFENRSLFMWHYHDWINPGDGSSNTPDHYIIDTFATSFNVAGIPLPVLIVNPDFEITELHETTETDQRKVVLSFSYSPKTFSPFATVRKGKMILLPDMFWLVHSMEIFITNAEVSDKSLTPTKLSMNFEYDLGTSIPLLKKSSWESRTNNQLVWSSNGEYDIKLVEKGTYSPHRFALPYYGLPEPDFDNSRRTNRVRYILMGLGAIMIGIALWRMIQKRWGQM